MRKWSNGDTAVWEDSSPEEIGKFHSERKHFAFRCQFFTLT